MKIVICYVFAFALPFLMKGQDCSTFGNYETYIKNNPEILAKNNAQLKNLGRCYVNSNQYREDIQSYSVPNSALGQFPDLIYLIVYSKSIESHDEKQSWFSLFSLMNEEQIDRLYDILIREKKKLNEIASKYSNSQSGDESAGAMTVSELKDFAFQTKYGHYIDLVNQKKYQLAVKEFNDFVENFPEWQIKKLTTFTYRVNDFILFEEFSAGNIETIKNFVLNEDIDNISENSISAQFLYLEYALTFCKDKDVKELVSDVFEDYKEIIPERKYFSDEWYYKLTQEYYNSGFNFTGTFEEIEQKAYQLAKSYHPNDFQSVRAYTLEYLCFYVLFQLKQSNPDYKVIAEIFSKSKLIYEDTNSPAYSFVEKGCMLVMENQLKGILPISVQEKMNGSESNETYLDKDPKNVAAWSIWFWFKEKHPFVKFLLIVLLIAVYAGYWYLKNVIFAKDDDKK
jgi:hypothetical protein